MKRLIVIIFSSLLLLSIESCLEFNFNDYDCSKYGMDMIGYCKRKYEVYELFRDNEIKPFLSHECDSASSLFIYSTVNDSTWLVKCSKDDYLYDSFSFLEGSIISVRNDTTIIDIGSVLIEDEFNISIYTLGQGIVNDRGIIHIDVTKEGSPCGWGHMDFSNGELYITTGIY